MKTQSGLIALLLFCCFLIFFACRGPNQPEPLYAPNFQKPRVTGIVLTDTEGNAVMVWGNPNGKVVADKDKTGDFLRMYLPYPNPTNGSVFIEYVLRTPSEITMWIVPAVGPNQERTNIGHFGNADFFSPGGVAIKVFFREEQRSPGGYRVHWDASEVPAGFYRAYIKTDGLLVWQDILIIRKKSDIPPGFPRNIFGEGLP
ncbi:hypothetical protein GWN91_06465 [Candidatus Saccharibacteria bacterium]|nr:hypothetical protein [Candidatus Saccharibacteria bacterium]NIW80210.1 hypothetical protein [Calditrichia bacterium]